MSELLRIKPLVWEELLDGLVAKTTFGNFSVFHRPKMKLTKWGWRCVIYDGVGEEGGICETKEQAIKAAEDYWRGRVYETLEAGDVDEYIIKERAITFNELMEEGLKLEAERLFKFFDYDHLPPDLQNISNLFCNLAVEVITEIDPGPERTVALRKLLEAKDAAVRAKKHPGG